MIKKILIRGILQLEKIERAVYEKISSEKAKRRIVNKSFTLLTPTCIGGVIYHKLGARFDSPTINTWMYKEEFVRFCADLRYYVCQKLIFYKHEERECPCAYIGEGEKRISIFFVHYETEEDAERKWIERCKRIQWDNIYIVACDGDNLGHDEMEMFEEIECKRKIMLISREEKSRKSTFVLYSLKNEETAASHQIREYKHTGLRTWEFEFDYVAWLNGEKDFRKKISSHSKKVLGIE